MAWYILSELESDQMESVNQVIKAVFEEYRLHGDDENFDAIKYFVNHSDHQISQLVSDIMSEKNKLSQFLTFCLVLLHFNLGNDHPP